MQRVKWFAIFISFFFITISGALTGQRQMFFMAGILLMLPAVSYLLGMFALQHLEFSREVPSSGWDGESVEFALIVHSRNRLPRMFLQVRDQLPEWLVPEDPEPTYFNAPPMARTRVPYWVQLNKRGAYKLEYLTITALDPLGIFAFSKRVHAEAEVLVLPVPEPMVNLATSGADRYGFREVYLASARGSGIDPDGVREYIPGDPLRRMHWKSTARTGRLNVIEFEEARALNVVMALDVHRSIQVGRGKASTFEYLVRAAASVAQSAVREGATVKLMAGERLTEGTGRGSNQLYGILSELARAEPDSDFRLSELLIGRLGALPAGTTLVLLTSGVDARLPDAVSRYTADGRQVVVIYADPSGFARTGHSPRREDVRDLLEGLLASSAVPYIIRQNEANQIRPETVEDVRFIQ